MNKQFFVGALLAAFVMASPVYSARALDGIAVISIQDIMRDSLAAKSVKATLEAKQKSFQDEMTQKEKALQAKEAALAGERGKSKPEDFEAKVKAFREEASKAQRDVQAKKNKLDTAFANSLETIQKTVVNIVTGIAKERKLKAVMPTSQMLYADPSLDITKEVLTKLNAQLPSVTVNF